MTDPQDQQDGVGRLIGWATLFCLALWIIAIAVSVLAAGSDKPVSSATESHVAWIDNTTDRWAHRDDAVTCASTEPEWAQTQAAAGLEPPQQGSYRYGFSYPQGGRVYFSPVVCSYLTDAFNRRFNGWNRRIGWLALVAWSSDVLVHEAFHTRLRDPNEANAEACAKKYLPVMLHETFRLRYHRALIMTMTRLAAFTRVGQPPEYQGGRCPQ